MRKSISGPCSSFLHSKLSKYWSKRFIWYETLQWASSNLSRNLSKMLHYGMIVIFLTLHRCVAYFWGDGPTRAPSENRTLTFHVKEVRNYHWATSLLFDDCNFKREKTALQNLGETHFGIDFIQGVEWALLKLSTNKTHFGMLFLYTHQKKG